MTFSEKLHISEVEEREPEDKEDWMTRIAKILLCDRKKHDVESYKSGNRCK